MRILSTCHRWACVGVCSVTLTCPSHASQPVLGTHAVPLIQRDDLTFRDLNRNNALEPFEDWRLTAAARAADLLARMTLAEKAGSVMHGTAPTAGDPLGHAQEYDLGQAQKLILEAGVTSFITRLSVPAARLAEQNNALQDIAERGRVAVPLLISTDPRNHFSSVVGASVAANDFSQWPGPLGLASTQDAELVRKFADIARQEYRATGLHMALSPQADLATEPRWSRIDGTFGEDSALVSRMVRAYVAGFQHGEGGVQPDGVAAVVKHWVGYGASEQGFDGHNYYGRFAVVSPQKLDDHIRPFDAAFDVEVAGVMPTYDVLRGLSLGGQPLESVGANFNRQLLTDLLRGQHGFTGLIVSDWAITKDCGNSCMSGTPPQSPAEIAMPWGVESLSKLERIAKAMNAGVDQFGGETDSGQLVEAVRTGKITEARLDQSVLRILELKFRLGLFENPFVDAARAAGIVGSPSFRQAALGAQRKSLVLLENRRSTLPLNPSAKRVFAEGISAAALVRHGLTPVHSAREAQVAIVRVAAPHRLLHPGFFFGSRQHEGRLDFEADSPDLQLIEATRRAVPTIVLVSLDRPAILTQLNRKVSALLVDFGVSEDVILDLLLGKHRPEGRLPFELPSSMGAVEAQAADAPHDSAHPLYPIFYGLQRY